MVYMSRWCFYSFSNHDSCEYDCFVYTEEGKIYCVKLHNKNGIKTIYPQFLNWFQIINIICFQRHDESQNDDEHQPFWKQYREKQIIVMTLAFLICWAPFAWIYIVKLLGMRDIDSRTIYDMLPLLCVKLGCTVINPIVYVFEKKRVRFKNTQNLSNIFNYLHKAHISSQ